MDKAKFFASLRSRGSGVFGTSLSQKQVDGLNFILDGAQSVGLKLQHLAYALATTYHETARTMQPIEEYGKGKGRKYGAPAGPHGKVYYGRGYVQLTWLENYQKASAKLGVDFVRNPERVMEPRLAASIMFAGMTEGWFAGDKKGRHTFARHITDGKADYVGARRIINGTDKASAIANYAKAFETALRAAGYAAAPAPRPIPSPVPPVDDPVVSVPPVGKKAPEAGKGGKTGALAIFIGLLIAGIAAYFGLG